MNYSIKVKKIHLRAEPTLKPLFRTLRGMYLKYQKEPEIIVLGIPKVK